MKKILSISGKILSAAETVLPATRKKSFFSEKTFRHITPESPCHNILYAKQPLTEWSTAVSRFYNRISYQLFFAPCPADLDRNSPHIILAAFCEASSWPRRSLTEAYPSSMALRPSPPGRMSDSS